jgi:hypothetical protein|tara:strand:- start:7264 stop:7455 length:192 start_codon:yes stop_codon:yes gene_type:complete
MKIYRWTDDGDFISPESVKYVIVYAPDLIVDIFVDGKLEMFKDRESNGWSLEPPLWELIYNEV